MFKIITKLLNISKKECRDVAYNVSTMVVGNWYQRNRRAIALFFLSLLIQLIYHYFIDTANLPGLTLTAQPSTQCNLVQAGRDKYESGKFSEAETEWNNAAQQYQILGDKLCQSMALSNLALAYQQQGNLSSALPTSQKSLQLILATPNTTNSPQLLKLAENFIKESKSDLQLKIIAQVLNNQGKLDLLTGQNEPAVVTWQLANQAYRKIKDQNGIIGSYINLAQALQVQGRYRDAHQNLLAALDLQLNPKIFSNDNSKQNNREFKKQITQAVKELPITSLHINFLNSFGNNYLSLGEYQVANDIFNYTLNGLEKNKQLFKASEYQEWLAETYLNLGNVKRALATRARDLGNINNEDNNSQDNVQDNAKDAIEKYQQAHQANSKIIQIQAELQELSVSLDTESWRRKTEPKLIDGKWQPQLEEWLNKSQVKESKLSQLETDINNLPKNLDSISTQINLQKKLIKLVELGILNAPSKKIIASQIDQTLYQAQDFYKSAFNNLNCWDENQKESRNINSKKCIAYQRIESSALGIKGNLYEIKKDWDKAEEYTQKALKSAYQSMENQDLAYQWQWQMGRILTQQGNITQAISQYQEAVKSLETIRGNLLGLNPEFQFSFRDNIEPIYRELVSLLLPINSAQVSQTKIKEAIKQIDNLQLAELQNFLRCNLSDLAQTNSNKASKHTLTTDEIIESKLADLEQHQAALIYPIILADRVIVIFKLPEQKLNYISNNNYQKTDIDNLVKQLQLALTIHSRTPQVNQLSSKLYKVLISPIKHDLDNSPNLETLIFVLDASLKNIPIAALYDEEHQKYLLKNNYAIAVAPSLLIVNSQYSSRSLRILAGAMTEERTVGTQKYEPLQNVKNEIESIGKKIPVKQLLDPEFTKINLQQQIDSGKFSLIHLATHGKFSSNPEETYLLTYDSTLSGQDLDNLVRPSSRNLQDLSNTIDLLTLSACETATGDNRAALGLAGISIRAGARSTLSTLWKADDEYTANFMEKFYTQLSNAKVTKAQALHRAQLAIFDEGFDTPHIWANYILIGNWL